MLHDLENERFTLANGLQVILHVEPTLPQVVTNLWYFVGSKDEPPGRSGFAHLFEHLMFMGTERVPGTAFDEIMEAGGGSNNASTSRDRTNYYASGPSNLLPTLLWLEADRMDALGRCMTQEKLDLQRDVVRNERRQSYENRPYGSTWLLLPEMMYPAEHPYHHAVIGSHEDLEAATVEDVQDFFSTWYRPDNASLVVAGDIDPARCRGAIEDLFGSIERGPRPRRRLVPPVVLDHCVRRTEYDEVPAARTVMGWHSPASFAPGDAACDLLACVLSEGAASRLEQALVHKRELAQNVMAFQHSGRLGSSFHVVATALPSVSLDEIEAAIDEEMQRLREEGPDEDECARARMSVEATFIRGLEGLAERADLLNFYNDVHGHPGAVTRDLERYRSVTADALGETCRLFDPDRRAILRIEPREKRPASASVGLQLSEAPDVGHTPHWDPPTPEISKLAHGTQVWTVRRSTVPLLGLCVVVDGGAFADPSDKLGRTSLLGELIPEAAGGRDAGALDHEMDLLGAEINITTRRLHREIQVSALTDHLDATLDIVADIVLRPALDDADFDRVKKLRLASLEQRRSNPEQIAPLVAQRMLYGVEHPLGIPMSGFVDTVQNVTHEELLPLYDEFRASLRHARIVAAGDLMDDFAPLETLLGLGGEASTPAPVEEVPARPLTWHFVHREAAPQTVIRFLTPLPPLGHPDTPALWLANSILGGAFTSRLNMNLREKHGFTYGASSAAMQGPRTGSFTAATSVKAEVTGRAVEEFLKELARMGDGDITEEERERAIATHRAQAVKAFESIGDVTSAFVALSAAQASPGLVSKVYHALGDVDLAAINAGAGRYLTGTTGVAVLVGDRETCLRQLESQGIDAITEVGPDGETLT